MSELRQLVEAINPSGALICEESWASVWPDAAPLAAAHAHEVDEGVEPRRKWAPDTEVFALLNLQGSFLVFSAREASGKLVGYITWTLQFDPESKELLTALMGPWYAAPESHCGGRLFDESLLVLKHKYRVQLAEPHHRLQGRGAKLGPFFKLRGAKEKQIPYSLWIGED